MKPGLNLGRPLSKAKYSLVTDSEQVPRGKGEKQPGEGDEIVPETIRLQGDDVPPHFYFRIGIVYAIVF